MAQPTSKYPWPEPSIISIYKEYARAGARQKALDEIRKALDRICDGEIDGKSRTPEQAIEYLRLKSADSRRLFANRTEKYIPHPTTFFHQSRYLRPPVEQADMPTRFEDCVAILEFHPHLAGREQKIRNNLPGYMPAVLEVDKALAELEKRLGKLEAVDYLKRRTALYARYVEDWPEEDLKYVSGIENFFSKRKYDQNERFWIRTKRTDYDDERAQIKRLFAE